MVTIKHYPAFNNVSFCLNNRELNSLPPDIDFNYLVNMINNAYCFMCRNIKRFKFMDDIRIIICLSNTAMKLYSVKRLIFAQFITHQ